MPAQILLLGLVVIAVATVVEFSIVMMAAQAAELPRGNPRASRWLKCLMGSALVGLGLRLALAPQHAG